MFINLICDENGDFGGLWFECEMMITNGVVTLKGCYFKTGKLWFWFKGWFGWNQVWVQICFYTKLGYLFNWD